MRICNFLSLLFLWIFLSSVSSRYTPDWTSLDSRPLPSWYDQAKFGIFIHWGVFSVPSYGCNEEGASGEWYWWNLNGAKEKCLVEWHQKTYGKDFKYQDFVTEFHTSMFNPNDWAKLFKDSGAKYVVLTSKHHEGFCNWPSPQSWNWNSVDSGPHQDNVGLLTDAVRKAGLKMGLYHSLFEWFNPLYLQDKSSNGSTNVYVETILLPQLRDIVNRYKPEVIWADGDWEMPDTYWQSREFLAWLYNDSPVKDTVCVNDRWGSGDTCHHGGYYTCQDRYNPGHLINHKWENAMTIDKGSWGFRRNANLTNYLTINELLYDLVSTISCGGNVLLNVGPTSWGTIPPIFADRLTQMGAWLKINGEAIYNTVPWRAQNDTVASDIWYTSTHDHVYATSFRWPSNGKLVLTQPTTTPSTSVMMLGYGAVQWSNVSGDLVIQLPSLTPADFKKLSSVAWTFRLSEVK